MPRKAIIDVATTTVFIGVASAAVLGMFVLKRKARNAEKEVDGTFLQLTDLENQLVSLGTAPISTLTWFEGDHKKSAEIIRERVERILKMNPWLLGRLSKRKGRVCIFLPSTIPPTVLDTVFARCAVDESPINRGMRFVDLAKAVQTTCAKMSLILTMGGEYKQSFWKVSIVPCSESPSARFGILVSMSHVIGDGHTFYSLHNMLLGEPIQSLEATRIQTSTKQQEEAVGKAEVGVMYSWGLIAVAVRGVFMSKVLSLFVGESLRSTIRYFTVDAEKLKKIKDEGKTDGTVPYVSTNDVISSWFLNNCGCSQGLMAVNFRNRLEGHTDLHAGNYENSLYFRNPADTASPSLIRRAVCDLKRAVTANQPYSNREFAWNHFGLVTNWASFHSKKVDLKGCKESLHLPLYEASIIPATMATCLIFQARPNQLAVLVAGTPDKIACLGKAPFESEQHVLV